MDPLIFPSAIIRNCPQNCVIQLSLRSQTSDNDALMIFKMRPKHEHFYWCVVKVDANRTSSMTAAHAERKQFKRGLRAQAVYSHNHVYMYLCIHIYRNVGSLYLLGSGIAFALI